MGTKNVAFEQHQYGVHTTTPFLKEMQQLDSIASQVVYLFRNMLKSLTIRNTQNTRESFRLDFILRFTESLATTCIDLLQKSFGDLWDKNQNRVKEGNNRTTTYENLPKIMVAQLSNLSVEGNRIITLNDWNQVEKFRSDEHNNIIHFNVGGNKQESMKRSQRDKFYSDDPTATIDDGALRIFGEFLGLTKFIERNNETLERVEIDESYICPSPFCDAGMVDFPNHDFKFSITRRRESPKWI
ncbi:hypothetical protein Ocin01_15363 [Orchesella cincta]|uniref:Uncharacterized protein n=1 Tax=Orchesella cincta TaxID=48709 RepID=A0A1D2MEA7_ORCCI|nr:hypothetical protein Ocin01_15363 [Orchesella cincta]